MPEFDEIKGLLATIAENHEARLKVLERKMDRRTAVISGAVSVVVMVLSHLAGCAAPQVVHPTPSEYRTARDAVVQLQIPGPRGPGYATGFWVSPGLVMTAGHACVEGQPDAVLTADGTVLAGNVLVREDTDGRDACVLGVPGYPTHPVLSFAPGLPESGGRVWYVGFPDTQLDTFAGTYLGLDDSGDERLSLPAYPGASGSPILDDSGRVVGVLVAIDPHFTLTTYATSLTVLADILSHSEVK